MCMAAVECTRSKENSHIHTILVCRLSTWPVDDDSSPTQHTIACEHCAESGNNTAGAHGSGCSVLVLIKYCKHTHEDPETHK